MKPMQPAVLLPVLAAAALIVWAVVASRGEDAQPGASTMSDSTQSEPSEAPDEPSAHPGRADGTKLATFGAGCFWCAEAVFEELDGVIAVESGYSNGLSDEAPTYKQVCSGTTGYAEVAQIRYDPERVSFAELLEVFWKTHDPTTLNRQGADLGTQYRSGVFFHDEEQRRVAEELKKKLDASGAYSAPIVTEITPLERYFPAEDYHQEYYAQNPNQGYCQAVIKPKLDKFRKAFADHLKKP